MNEPILADDYPIYADYCYVADGKVVRSDWHDITVARFKLLLGAKEIRRCDALAREMLAVDALLPFLRELRSRRGVTRPGKT